MASDQRPQCTNAKASEPPCGQCRACVDARASRHPALRIVTLEINEKTDKLRSEITVEQIRKLSEWLALTSQRGGAPVRSEEPTSELQSLMGISSAVFCVKYKPIT